LLAAVKYNLAVQDGSPDYGLWLILLVIHAVIGESFNMRWS